MSLLPTDNGPLAAILGQSGPSWLPQQTRANPFGQQNSGLRGLLGNPTFALQLLANSGYSPQKRSFGEILGTSALQTQQMGQQQQDSELDRAYRQAQIEALKQPRGGNSPASVQEYEYAKQNGFHGSFQDWIVAGGQTSRPSAVQEWEHYQKLTPEQKQAYLEMKRTPPWKVDTINQTPTVIQGLPGGEVNTIPLSTPQSEIAMAAARKSAESEAGAIGAGAGAIQAGIQTKGANAKTVQGMLDIADPLIDLATGSGVGTAADKVAGFFGKSLKGSEAIAQLQVLQAGLMTNMPRMEGPQSDRDVELYRQAAGQLGDPMVPRQQKKAAIKTIREMQKKYEDRAAGGMPFQIFAPGSPQDDQRRSTEFNNLLDKYAPRK